MDEETLTSRLQRLAAGDYNGPVGDILIALAGVAKEPRDPADPLTLRNELKRAALLLRGTHGCDALSRAHELAERTQTTFARGVVATLEWMLRAEKRQAALDSQAIVDTPPEANFDDIVLIASHACAVPYAAINFITTDRQWAKALKGGHQRNMPLDESVCGQVIDEPDIVIINDLAAHSETASLKAVIDGGMRFYASAPIRTSTGVIVGRLCVVDYHARSKGLDVTQNEVLQALARQVTTQLELRRFLQTAD